MVGTKGVKPRARWATLVVCILFIASCGDTKKEAVAPKVTIQETKQQPDPVVEAYMAAGRKVYDSHCLVCHQANGDGVPGLNPSLFDSERVQGEKKELLQILLYGSTEGLSTDGNTYTNNMPGFEHLSDEEIANLASYIRNSFENKAPAITIAEVKNLRQGQ